MHRMICELFGWARISEAEARPPDIIESVGPRRLNAYDLDEFNDALWLVYWYEADGYVGRGIAVAAYVGGFKLVKLGHCSCHGPTERTLSTPKLSESELLHAFKVDECGHVRNPEDCDWNMWIAVGQSVRAMIRKEGVVEEPPPFTALM